MILPQCPNLLSALIILFACNHLAIAVIYVRIHDYYVKVSDIQLVLWNTDHFLVLDSMLSSETNEPSYHVVYDKFNKKDIVVPASVVKNHHIDHDQTHENIIENINCAASELNISSDAVYTLLSVRYATIAEFVALPNIYFQMLSTYHSTIAVRDLLEFVRSRGLLNIIMALQSKSDSISRSKVESFLRFIELHYKDRLIDGPIELFEKNEAVLWALGSKILKQIPISNYWGFGNTEDRPIAVAILVRLYRYLIRSGSNVVEEVTIKKLADWILELYFKDITIGKANITNVFRSCILTTKEYTFEEHRNVADSVVLPSILDSMFEIHAFAEKFSAARILAHIRWQIEQFSLHQSTILCWETESSVSLAPFIGFKMIAPSTIDNADLTNLLGIIESFKETQLFNWCFLPQYLYIIFANPIIYQNAEMLNRVLSLLSWIKAQNYYLQQLKSFEILWQEVNPVDNTFDDMADNNYSISDLYIAGGGKNPFRKFMKALSLKMILLYDEMLTMPSISGSKILFEFFNSNSLIDPAPLQLAEIFGIENMLSLIVGNEELMLKFGSTIRPFKLTMKYQDACWKSHLESTFRRIASTFLIFPNRNIHRTVISHHWDDATQRLFVQKPRYQTMLSRKFIDGLILDVYELFHKCHENKATTSLAFKPPTNSFSPNSSSSDSPNFSDSNPSVPDQSNSEPTNVDLPTTSYRKKGLISKLYREGVNLCSGFYTGEKQVVAMLKILASLILKRPKIIDIVSLYRLVNEPILPKGYSEYKDLVSLLERYNMHMEK